MARCLCNCLQFRSEELPNEYVHQKHFETLISYTEVQPCKLREDSLPSWHLFTELESIVKKILTQ